MRFQEKYAKHLRYLANIEGGERLVMVSEDLSGHDFEGLDLNRASLLGCNLTDAKFRGANLSTTDFTGSDLTRADLSFCKMSYAILAGATIADNKLCETIGNKKQIKTLQLDSVILTYTWDKIYCDCLSFEFGNWGLLTGVELDILHPAAREWFVKWDEVVRKILIMSPPLRG